MNIVISRKASSVLASHPVKITSGSEAKKLVSLSKLVAVASLFMCA